jgi:DNA-binding beta-propeller fold protein YncE
VLIDEDRARVWVVNPDAGTVSVVDMASLETVVETKVGEDPRSLARAPDGSVWVVNRGSSELSVLDADSAGFSLSVPLPYAALPFGIVFSPDGRGFVALAATGQVAVIDPVARTVTSTVDLGPDVSGVVPRVRGIALSYDGQRLFVPRFITGAAAAEVYEIDAASLALTRTFLLANDPGPDTENSGRGIPNYLSSIALSPDGVRAWLPSKKDNMDRGVSRDGQALNTDNTVRTVVSQLDLEDNSELSSGRIDINDHDMAAAATFSPAGDLVFVASQGTNQIDVFDAYDGSLVAGIATGLAPQGLELDSAGRLWVQSFLSRSLAVYDASGVLAGTDGAAAKLGEVVTVAEEPLAPEVLLGKQIFYNADSRQMSQDGYTSCASCHLDGDDDGRVWDFTDRGEGYRNTISLVGKAGTRHGPVHWTGNFDEIQDFENDIRAHFGGSGFMSDEDFNAETRSDPLGTPKAGLSPPLDALASYVSSLNAFPKSPYRKADGTLTEHARAGQALFDTLDCGTCHAGEGLTDSARGVLHDVGTLQPTSGQRRGEPLTGLDTPTLRGLWATAPYLHDGSAPTLRAVIDNPRHGDASALNDAEKKQLVAFLLELEDSGDVVAPRSEPRLEAAGGCACRAAGLARPHGAAVWWLLGMLVASSMRRKRLAARVRPTYW